MGDTQAGARGHGAAGGRWRGAPALLLGTIALAIVALVLVITAGSRSHAGASPPPTATVPGPAPTPGLYLMTEGALQMEMTALAPGSPDAATLDRLRGMVRQAAAVEDRYRDLDTALADGYITAPDLLVDTQGQHYFQPQYFEAAAQGRFDPLHPPFLVYTHSSAPRLSGLLYYLPPWTPRSRLASIVPPSLAAWHEHVNVCVVGGDSLLTGTAVLPIHDRPTCVAQGGSFTERSGWMVHLWAGEPLGRSLFAMDRPRH